MTMSNATTTPTSSAAPSTADLDAARLLLDRLGISPTDLMASTGREQRAPAPTFAEYIPTVAAAVSPGTRRVYGTYWNRILEHWGARRLDEPTPSQIQQLAEQLKAGAISDHDGVFVVRPEHVDAYIARHRPLCLRQTMNTRIPDHLSAINFGVAKGLTCDRVLIFPSGPIRDFINKAKPMTGKSACGFYVAVTRAIHSVAFVMDGRKSNQLAAWTLGA